jgi:hypothetical protein
MLNSTPGTRFLIFSIVLHATFFLIYQHDHLKLNYVGRNQPHEFHKFRVHDTMCVSLASGDGCVQVQVGNDDGLITIGEGFSGIVKKGAYPAVFKDSSKNMQQPAENEVNILKVYTLRLTIMTAILLTLHCKTIR